MPSSQEAHAQAVVHGAPVGNPTASAQGAMKGLARSLSYGSRRSGGLHGAEFWAEALEEIYKAPVRWDLEALDAWASCMVVGKTGAV